MAWTDIRNGNPLKPRLRGGETLLGCFQRIPAPEITELAAAAGFDFVVIDLEHTPASEERAAGLIRTAEAAVRATRYPPKGSRGLAAPRQAGYGARMSLAEFVKASEEWPLIVVQVESRSGLDELEGIAAVEGVDVVFIGLTDLSQDLGVTGEYDDPGLREAVDGAFRAITSCGKGAGVPVTGAAMAQEYVGRGAAYLTANDVRLLLESGRSLVGQLRGGA